MFTNKEILRIALEQSAIDSNCQWDDFLKDENVVVKSVANPKARKYLKLPHVCDLTSYGSNIVATINEDYRDIVEKYINKYAIEHCFETPNLHVLNDAFRQYDLGVCFMAEYFLPDVDALKALPCKYEMKVLEQPDFADLYKPEWSNALCEDRKQLDVLGVGAYDNGILIGLAACSADGEEMWQIGIDVLKGYRRQGIAAALTSNLAMEILKRDKVPFYCCAWSNIKSARNAIKSGFRPAWAEVTVKPLQMINEMNGLEE